MFFFEGDVLFIQLIGSSVLTSQCFGEGWKYVRIGHARVSRVSSVQMSYARSFGRSVRAYARVWKRKGQMYYCLPPAPDIQGLPIRSGRAQDQRSVILVTPICRLLLGFPRAPVNHGVFISLPDL